MTIVGPSVAADGVDCFRPCLRSGFANSSFRKDDHGLEYTAGGHELDGGIVHHLFLPECTENALLFDFRTMTSLYC